VVLLPPARLPLREPCVAPPDAGGESPATPDAGRLRAPLEEAAGGLDAGGRAGDDVPLSELS
jgi:hypothetical protein